MRSRLDASRRLSSRAGWRRLARHERSVCARCSAPAASGQVARGRQTRSSYGSTTIYLLRRAASQVHAVGMHADCGRAAAAPGSPLSCRSAWSHSALPRWPFELPRLVRRQFAGVYGIGRILCLPLRGMRSHMSNSKLRLGRLT